MTTDLAKIGQEKGSRAKGMQAMLYKYDQLYRLVQSRSLTNYNGTSGFAARAAGASAYDEDYSYDANGNILTLKRRNASGGIQDDLNYRYYHNTNKLREVTPVVRDTTYQSGAIVTNHKVYRNITIGGTAYIAAGSTVQLNASDNIFINPGFDIQDGSDFYAHVLGEDEGTFMYDGKGNLAADQDKGARLLWTPNGKLREIRSKIDSVVVSFRYDGLGYRIEKRVVTPDTTYSVRYVRDTEGNVMATYRDTTVHERFIYGKMRVGVYVGKTAAGTLSLGERSYELANHLGNVLSVITDHVRMTRDSAWATVIDQTDYYPFGLAMEGRTFHAKEEYRYGFNTQEKVDELGVGHYTAEFWEYDARIGRRWNLDPKPLESESGYAVNRNNPVFNSDPKGDNPILGALLGAFTEYAGIIGNKMLFEGMSFTEANKDLGWRDALDITVAAGFGAASGAIDGGITKFAAWISKPAHQKIIVLLLKVGVSAIEGSLKAMYKKEDFDLMSVLAGALTEVGMGELVQGLGNKVLRTDLISEGAEQTARTAKATAERAKDLARRRAPIARLVKRAEKEAATAKVNNILVTTVDQTAKATTGSVAKTAANKAQDAAKSDKGKDKKDDKATTGKQ